MITKYIQVGILNTFITLVIIFICTNILNINYEISYFIGFIIGFINSFILNKNYTFKSKNNWKKEIIPFFIVFILSYIISHLSLIYLVQSIQIDKNIAIIVSMLIYTIIGFILNKTMTFKKGKQ
jgi:putative flippase GtrA